MKIRIEMVGYLAGIGLPGGFKGGEVDMPEGAVVLDLLRAVQAPITYQFLISRDDMLVDPETPLREGDVLFFIPPIGGG